MKEHLSPRDQFFQQYNSTEHCYKCLMKEWGNAALTIREYVDSIPKQEKVSPHEYERRLSICRQCEHHVNGMCALCGCFVMVRGAKSKQNCAKKERLW